MPDLATICNLALGRVGDLTIVADVANDAGTGARAFRRAYRNSLELMLSMCAWPFAGGVDTPAALAQAAPLPWRYAYPYPSDCLTFRGAFVDDSWRRPVRAQVMAAKDDDGRDIQIVLCDITAPVFRYTRRIEDPSLFPPGFTEALCWHLAVDMSTSLGRSREFRSDAEKQFQARLSSAMTQAMREQPWMDRPSGRVRARHGHGRGFGHYGGGGDEGGEYGGYGGYGEDGVQSDFDDFVLPITYPRA